MFNVKIQRNLSNSNQSYRFMYCIHRYIYLRRTNDQYNECLANILPKQYNCFWIQNKQSIEKSNYNYSVYVCNDTESTVLF